ncbi:MAG: hypothetical protein HKN56_09750 [Gammaproteobacteria bacterium]|nr:hypothetical protein [Gammaproteobacteria bacterium]
MTSITSTTPVALAGIRNNLDGLTEVSQQVASASVDGAEAIDYAVTATEALEYRNGVDASAAALKRANEALGTLLDELV